MLDQGGAWQGRRKPHQRHVSEEWINYRAIRQSETTSVASFHPCGRAGLDCRGRQILSRAGTTEVAGRYLNGVAAQNVCNTSKKGHGQLDSCRAARRHSQKNLCGAAAAWAQPTNNTLGVSAVPFGSANVSAGADDS
jgi:hypothetical protein